ncbi:hypothetical protein GCM10008096_00890 [Zhihengliuella salsuginis]|uniref:Uncharacterized protein n=1 Tax=Zhihengliuella salsuginis TaxID=578222 RepID=A0ABQ3GAR9_9MICC|nr:hypothetical protein GCM10008096_00890 [Zhihengliuella salsuginis]
MVSPVACARVARESGASEEASVFSTVPRLCSRTFVSCMATLSSIAVSRPAGARCLYKGIASGAFNEHTK